MMDNAHFKVLCSSIKNKVKELNRYDGHSTEFYTELYGILYQLDVLHKKWILRIPDDKHEQETFF